MNREPSWVRHSVPPAEYRHCQCGKILAGGPRYNCPVCNRSWNEAFDYELQSIDDLRWPICLSCYETMGHPKLIRVPAFPLSGPAIERIAAGMCEKEHEYCSVCGTGTLAGVYLRENPRKEVVR